MDCNMQSITSGLASHGVFPSKGIPDIIRVMLMSVLLTVGRVLPLSYPTKPRIRLPSEPSTPKQAWQARRLSAIALIGLTEGLAHHLSLPDPPDNGFFWILKLPRKGPSIWPFLLESSASVFFEIGNASRLNIKTSQNVCLTPALRRRSAQSFLRLS